MWSSYNKKFFFFKDKKNVLKVEETQLVSTLQLILDMNRPLRHERQSEWHVKWLITVFFVYFKQMRSMSAPHSPPVPARKNEIRATGNLYHIL